MRDSSTEWFTFTTTVLDRFERKKLDAHRQNDSPLLLLDWKHFNRKDILNLLYLYSRDFNRNPRKKGTRKYSHSDESTVGNTESTVGTTGEMNDDPIHDFLHLTQKTEKGISMWVYHL